MNEIIISAGRSHSKTLDEILQSEEYKTNIEKLRAAGLTVEDLHSFAKMMSKSVTDHKETVDQLIEASERFRSAGEAIDKSLLDVKKCNINHVNPYYRQYKRK